MVEKVVEETGQIKIVLYSFLNGLFVLSWGPALIGGFVFHFYVLLLSHQEIYRNYSNCCVPDISSKRGGE
jgi:hypothetical protein